jgi:hypothetical protein
VPSADVLGIIADQAREVAHGWSRPDADPAWALVAALFDAVADDNELLRLAAEIPLERLPALLLVASIQRVLADHPTDPLARYYPGPDQQPVDEVFGAVLHRFVTGRDDEVRRWFTRRYQMNEVGRCTQIALAVGVVQRLSGCRPLALIDVGTGSGLGLHFDRYHVDLGDGRTFGPADSSVRLSCAVVGAPPVPPAPPAVAVRIGIDASPIDLNDAEARAWLAACTPPTADAQTRLAEAVAITQAAGTPIIAGDGAQALAGAIEAIPDDLLVVVTDSYTAVFLDDAGRQAMRDAVAAARRDAVWISLDPLVPLGTGADRCVHQLPVPPDLIERNHAGGVFALLSVVGSIGAMPIDRILGTAHPSGTRMTWLDHDAPDPAPRDQGGSHDDPA